MQIFLEVTNVPVVPVILEKTAKKVRITIHNITSSNLYRSECVYLLWCGK